MSFPILLHLHYYYDYYLYHTGRMYLCYHKLMFLAWNFQILQNFWYFFCLRTYFIQSLLVNLKLHPQLLNECILIKFPHWYVFCWLFFQLKIGRVFRILDLVSHSITFVIFVNIQHNFFPWMDDLSLQHKIQQII